MQRCKVAECTAAVRIDYPKSPMENRRMKQFNRKPLFLGLALTLAAPIAFAQSTSPQSSTQSTDPQTTTTQPTQSQDTQSTSTQSTTTQSDTQSTDTQSSTAGTQSSSGVTNEATATSTTGAQKRNWSDLDLDKNGSLSSTEAAPISSLSQSFTTADANADGELTQDEYKAFLASSGKDKAPGSDK